MTLTFFFLPRCARLGSIPTEIDFQEQVSKHLQAAVVKSRGSERWRKSARKTRAGEYPRDERK